MRPVVELQSVSEVYSGADVVVRAERVVRMRDGRTVTDRAFIRELARGFDAIMEGRARWRIGRSYFGSCGEAVFDRFSILVPLDSPYRR